MEALGFEQARDLLTPAVIASLWPPPLREHYARVRCLVRGDPVPAIEWSPESARRLRRTVLSDRWYSAR